MNIDKELIFKNASDLVPAVIQDDNTFKVLMLGYMNRESFEKTVEDGRVTFFSRSRQRLWTKGESSSNYLYVRSIETDCDNDTLLIRVDPAGPVCHTGSNTCFNNETTEGFIGRLQQVIRERHIQMPAGSYTTELFEKGAERISKKVGEEAAEVIIEAIKGDKKRLVYEAGDLIYHLLVLLELYGLSISDIEKELYSRHSK
ncbi:MAG: Phosphoribosyl-ATP pyrophosphatase /phosphoribosyl-AMP cyclohydrolase [uncultured bacterium]|nr:MAG: Phosphoribosyl-ATP pyrophosphatase /phosphoribosyl-AMP cyclohydrolase [uncultured bacterium]HBY02680.1 bifunctional phosphoribosyl-AMP cyclohydrolase/phosphoribosyl-ATP diphosphatase [Rikenellaceae bacterium]